MTQSNFKRRFAGIVAGDIQARHARGVHKGHHHNNHAHEHPSSPGCRYDPVHGCVISGTACNSGHGPCEDDGSGCVCTPLTPP